MSPDAKRKAPFVTNEGLFQFRVMPLGLCNAPATFERLMGQVLCGMQWSRCLVYLDYVISFGGTIMEALARLEEVLGRLSNFGLQLKAKKCTFQSFPVKLSNCQYKNLIIIFSCMANYHISFSNPGSYYVSPKILANQLYLSENDNHFKIGCLFAT